VSAIEDVLNEIGHEGMLALVIDGVLVGSKSYRKATKKILRLQRRLQRAIARRSGGTSSRSKRR
jgi:hypothetical protein